MLIAGFRLESTQLRLSRSLPDTAFSQLFYLLFILSLGVSCLFEGFLYIPFAKSDVAGQPQLFPASLCTLFITLSFSAVDFTVPWTFPDASSRSLTRSDIRY